MPVKASNHVSGRYDFFCDNCNIWEYDDPKESNEDWILIYFKEIGWIVTEKAILCNKCSNILALMELISCL